VAGVDDPAHGGVDVLVLVRERLRPEVGEGMRVLGVEDELGAEGVHVLIVAPEPDRGWQGSVI
jgi:hypothetical protein